LSSHGEGRQDNVVDVLKRSKRASKGGVCISLKDRDKQRGGRGKEKRDSNETMGGNSGLGGWMEYVILKSRHKQEWSRGQKVYKPGWTVD